MNFAHLMFAVGFGLTLMFLVFMAGSIFFVKGFFESLWGKFRKVGILTIAIAAFGLVFAATQIDLTTQVKGILPSANGGTGSAFFGISGPTAARTYTLPDAAATILTSNAAVTVGQGGTGLTAVAADQVFTGTASNVLTAKTIPDCTDSTGNHLNYTQSTHVWSCGTSSSGGTVPNFADNEVPSGTINGSTTAFTLAHTPNPAASLVCFENGIAQRAAGADFTLSTATVTYGVAPPTGATLVCSYRW